MRNLRLGMLLPCCQRYRYRGFSAGFTYISRRFSALMTRARHRTVIHEKKTFIKRLKKIRACLVVSAACLLTLLATQREKP